MPNYHTPQYKFIMQKPSSQLPGAFEDVEAVLSKHFHKTSIHPYFSLIIEGDKYTIDHHNKVHMHPNLYKGQIFDSSRRFEVTNFPFKYADILEAVNKIEIPKIQLNGRALKI